MFVDPTRGRLQGYARYALGAAAGVLVLGACETPAQNTDLRPEGPPDVLAVLVGTDASAQLGESATYCRPNDEKRPTTVGLPDFTLSSICDDDLSKPAAMVTTAYPDGWYVRIMFDELLDPDIEELVEILDPETDEGTDTFTGTLINTQPVRLECESVAGGFVDVPYDGYYSPAGNSVTWPLGPALVIKPDEPRAVATNKKCRVTIRENVKDKAGTSVPADQRGPFEFQIAPITPIVIDPSDGSDIDAFVLSPNGDNVFVQFNTDVDPDSFCDEPGANPCEFEITPVDTGLCDNAAGTGSGDYCLIANAGSDCPAAETCQPAGVEHFPLSLIGLSGTEFAFYTLGAVQTAKEYTFSFLEGTKVKDRCGVETTFGAPSVADNTKITVNTNPFDFKALAPGNGDLVAPLTRPNLSFNNVIDPSTFEASEFSISPLPATPSVVSSTGGNLLFGGNYQPASPYTFTLNAGATVSDAFGVVYTNAMEKKITYMTQPITLTTVSPADKGTLTKATPASPTRVSISFNQNMNPATLDTTDFTFTGTAGPVAVVAAAASPATCTTTATSCSLRVESAAPLLPGEYTFTLKAGATISDVLGNVYTQTADRTVKFTVKDAAPPTPPIQCL